MFKFLTLAIAFVLLLILSGNGFAKDAGSAGPSLGGMGGQKVLEVKGQTRSLNMLQSTQAEKDQINFVKHRRNFRNEIKTTTY